jgi:murein L,D-transpeptidase YafK
VSKNKALAQRLPFHSGDAMHSKKRSLIGFEAFALLALACSGSAAHVEKATQPVEQKSTSAPRTTLMTEQPLTLPLANPRIEVSKGKRELGLYDGTRLLRTYHVGLGFSPVEDKVCEGDGRTPEGEYYVCVKNANSKFYLSLGISYPNIEDANRGLRDELITKRQHDQIADAIAAGKRPPWDTKLGGEIFIHGNGSSNDWTWGCVAVEDAEIKELFDAVPMGTRVRIVH